MSVFNNSSNNTNAQTSLDFVEQSMDTLINDYLKTNTPCVYILTPCYGSVCFVNYLCCLMNTKELFRKFNIELHIEFCKSDSLVSRARNNLVAKAMTNPNMTHIIFIDNDITWDPMDIIKLILSEKQLVGGIYPLKHYDWNKLVPNEQDGHIIQTWIDNKNKSSLKNVVPNDKIIQHKILRYNLNLIDNKLDIQNNLAKVKHIANGFMMIRRNVIEKMSQAFPSTKYVDDIGFLSKDENNYAYALFDCGVEEGHYYSEDWLFCHRWSKMGGSIWVDVSINLIHTGTEDYSGSFLSSIF